MNTIDQIAFRIIREQELIIGPLAWLEARKVSGISVEQNSISIGGDGKSVIDRLVAQYERLFGKASREVCRQAAAPLLSELNPGEVPASLK